MSSTTENPMLISFIDNGDTSLSVSSPAHCLASHLMDINFLHLDTVSQTPRTFVVQVYDVVDEKEPYDVDLLEYISQPPNPRDQGKITIHNRLYLDPSACKIEVINDENGKTVTKPSNIANILNPK